MKVFLNKGIDFYRSSKIAVLSCFKRVNLREAKKCSTISKSIKYLRIGEKDGWYHIKQKLTNI